MAYSYDDRDREFRQSPPPRPPRKEDNDLGSWILIIFLFIVAWPAGLAVLLSKVLGNDSRRKNAARSTRSTVSRSDPAVSRANPNPSQARPGTASAAGRKVTKTPQYSAKAARNMKIVGLVLLFAGLVSLVEGIGAATGGLSWALLASLFPTMGLAAGGLGLLLAGGVMTRRARRFGKYLACAHGQEAVSLKKLAVAADVSPRKVENDLEIMIEKGLWGENAYLDLGSDMLFRSPEAADAFFGKKKQEQKDPAARPRIAGQPLDLSQYGTIYLGYPIWWGTAPRIINTFLDSYDLTGKTIRPFCTSGSSGIETSVADIRAAVPEVNVTAGLRVDDPDGSALKSWVRE